MDIFGYKLNDNDLWLLGAAGALFTALVGSLLYRANVTHIAKRESHAKHVANCLAPFEDAISNIHLGEENHICIMRSFFRAQEEAIAVFQAKAQGNASIQLQKAWNNYKQHYKVTAKDRIYSQFADSPEPQRTNELDLLHKHLTQIIKAVKTMKGNESWLNHLPYQCTM